MALRKLTFWGEGGVTMKDQQKSSTVCETYHKGQKWGPTIWIKMGEGAKQRPEDEEQGCGESVVGTVFQMDGTATAQVLRLEGTWNVPATGGQLVSCEPAKSVADVRPQTWTGQRAEAGKVECHLTIRVPQGALAGVVLKAALWLQGGGGGGHRENGPQRDESGS